MPPASDEEPRSLGRPARWSRWVAASVLLIAGGLLAVLSGAWRGIEAMVAADTIHLVTGQATTAVPARHLLILYEGTSIQSIFVLTGECSVAYLLAAFLIGSAPLMLLRKLPPWRTAKAVAVTAAVLILVNTARLTTIGATVSAWGRDPGLQIAHTYLGSLLTVVGACAAGIAFAAVLVGGRKTRRLTAG